ncbi:MAG: oligosaccharide flippase family protein [Pirellulales bacterium]
MILHRRIALGVLASYIARALQIVLSLVLIPIMFRRLSSEVIGIWWLLSQASLFLGLMDFGFSPTLTRRIAFAKGISGEHIDVELNPESRRKLGDLFCTGKIVFRSLALVILFGAGGCGALLLGYVPVENISHSQVLSAWALFCLGYAINAWGGLWISLLGGLGYVGIVNLITIVMQVIATILKIVVVTRGGGLLSLAVVDCVAAIATRQLMRLYLMWKEPEVLTLPGTWSSVEFRSILSPALKFWVTTLGAFLILKTDEIFITNFLGAAAIADYRAAYSVINCLYTLALTLSLVSMPIYSQLWQSGNLGAVQSVLMRNLSIGLGIMVAGVAGVLLASPSLFNIWLGAGHFIGFPILGVFSAMLLLETQHVIFASAARSTEDEVYALWALGAGILNLVFTWILGRQFGLLGIALGTFTAQLVTNNWYCVYHGLERLQVSFSTYAKRILAPLAALAVAIALPLAIILFNLPESWERWLDWVRLLIVGGYCGLALAVFLWYFAFDAPERARIIVKIKSAPPGQWVQRLLAPRV